MHALTVVVAQADCIVAEHLAANLHAHFKNVVIARDTEEIRTHIQHDLADIVVVDLDLTEPRELQSLIREFQHMGFVCTHRAPDEEMWKQCLDFGAIDCCACDDLNSIVRAARRYSQSMAVSAA